MPAQLANGPQPPPPQYSTTSSSLLLLLRTVESQGHAAEPLLEEVGLDLEIVRDGSARVPVEVMGRLWRRAGEVTANPAFGLACARLAHPTSFGPISIAMYAAPTVGAVLDLLVRFGITLSSGGYWWKRQRESALDLVSAPRFAMADEAVDCFYAVLMKILRDSCTGPVVPCYVSLARREPADKKPWQAVFGEDVRFDPGALSVVRFPASLVEARLHGYNAPVYEHALDLLSTQVTMAHRGLLSSSARAQILICLHEGENDIESVARRLGMTTRTLQRRLKREGHTFAGLLDDVRRELARRYLTRSTLTISKIGEMLVYEDLSSFSRACSRWFGQSPLQLRKGSSE